MEGGRLIRAAPSRRWPLRRARPRSSRCAPTSTRRCACSPTSAARVGPRRGAITPSRFELEESRAAPTSSPSCVEALVLRGARVAEVAPRESAHGSDVSAERRDGGLRDVACGGANMSPAFAHRVARAREPAAWSLLVYSASVALALVRWRRGSRPMRAAPTSRRLWSCLSDVLKPITRRGRRWRWPACSRCSSWRSPASCMAPAMVAAAVAQRAARRHARSAAHDAAVAAGSWPRLHRRRAGAAVALVRRAVGAARAGDAVAGPVPLATLLAGDLGLAVGRHVHVVRARTLRGAGAAAGVGRRDCRARARGDPRRAGADDGRDGRHATPSVAGRCGIRRARQSSMWRPTGCGGAWSAWRWAYPRQRPTRRDVCDRGAAVVRGEPGVGRAARARGVSQAGRSRSCRSCRSRKRSACSRWRRRRCSCRSASIASDGDGRVGGDAVRGAARRAARPAGDADVRSLGHRRRRGRTARLARRRRGAARPHVDDDARRGRAVLRGRRTAGTALDGNERWRWCWTALVGG